jgi:hypothetical protein
MRAGRRCRDKDGPVVSELIEPALLSQLQQARMLQSPLERPVLVTVRLVLESKKHRPHVS